MSGETLAKVSFTVNHPPCRPQVDDVTVMMHVMGSAKELGIWDPVHSKRLKRGSDGAWEITMYLPKGCEVQYQYALKDFDEKVVWQGQLVRQHRVDSFSALQQIKDKIMDDEGAPLDTTVRHQHRENMSSEVLLGPLLAPVQRRTVPNRHLETETDKEIKGEYAPIFRAQRASAETGAASSCMALPNSVMDMMSREKSSGPEMGSPPPERKTKKTLEAVGEEDERDVEIETPKASVPSPATPPTVEKDAGVARAEGVRGEAQSNLVSRFYKQESEKLEAHKRKERADVASSERAGGDKEAVAKSAEKTKNRQEARNDDMRSKFMRFLEREKDRKRQSLNSLKRRTLDADAEQREQLESNCSSLSQELCDLDDLLLDTREAVVMEAMERLEAQKQWREARDALAAQRPSSDPAPPPPVHHRAASFAAPPASSSAPRLVPRAAAHIQAPLDVRHAPRSKAFSVDSSCSSHAHQPPRNRLVRARDAYCNTVNRRIAKPVVGPVDRMLGRMSRWVYGDPRDSCSLQSTQEGLAGKSGCVEAKCTGLIGMCCTVDQDVLHDLSATTLLVGPEERLMLEAAAEAAAQKQAAAESQKKVPDFYRVEMPSAISRSAIVV